jgi:pimeloyl-ACP methyl ester carboxylesterase
MNDQRGEFVPVPGGRLYVEVDGPVDGQPLTLIHAGVAHLRMWDDQVPGFTEAGYRVIRYDTRGFGRTETEDVPFSNRDDVAAVLDHLGVARTHLLGISRGGTIALDFALERPARVASLMLFGASPGGFDFEDPSMAPLWQRSEALEEAGDWDALVELEVDMWLEGVGQPQGRTGSDLREKMTRWGHDNYSEGRLYGQARSLEPRAVGRLGEVAVPSLVAWGDLDEAATVAAGPVMADGIPGARRHVFPGAAHMTNLEQPAEFERLVLDFLSGTES